MKKGGKQLPPVRGRKAVPVTKRCLQTISRRVEAKKENRIPGYDFRAWDKYDVDKECEKMDDKEKAQEEARKRRARRRASGTTRKRGRLWRIWPSVARSWV